MTGAFLVMLINWTVDRECTRKRSRAQGVRGRSQTLLPATMQVPALALPSVFFRTP